VVAFLQGKTPDYREWVAKNAVDIAIDTYVALLLLEQAEKWDHKRMVVKKFVADMMPRVAMNRAYVLNAEPVLAAT
jgi:hypothetical protein